MFVLTSSLPEPRLQLSLSVATLPHPKYPNFCIQPNKPLSFLCSTTFGIPLRHTEMCDRNGEDLIV